MASHILDLRIATWFALALLFVVVSVSAAALPVSEEEARAMHEFDPGDASRPAAS